MSGNLPDTYCGVAFNAEPFDPSAVLVWVDLSARLAAVGEATRGRSQYELDQGQTGMASVVWLDPDEWLNPGNTASPYYPYIQPYRNFCLRAMWPNGGTGNLLLAAGEDGSFESYANTAALAAAGWFSTANTATVALATVGAWQGTNCAVLTIPINSMGLGRLTLPCIPGRQYTLQSHVNFSGPGTAMMAVEGMTIAVDTFGRTTASNWGTPVAPVFFGPTWTVLGTAANYSTSAGTAFLSCTAVNVRQRALTGANVYDSDQTMTMAFGSVPTAGNSFLELNARYLDANNNYFAQLILGAAGDLVMKIVKRTAGSEFILATANLPGVYTVGTKYTCRFTITGTTLSFKAWKATAGVAQPQAYQIVITDSAITGAGQIGVSAFLSASYTGTLPSVMSFQDYRSTGSVVPGSASTGTTGSYQLLTNTFTATQPQHTVRFGMFSTVGSGAVTLTIDGIQHEPGAVANTFTTAGPILRSAWTRGYVERFPSEWMDDSRGFYGLCKSPVVGPSFVPATAEIGTEYRSALMSLSPDYLWALNGSGTSFAETSGNNGPPLLRYDAIEGPGTLSVQAQTNIPGDTSGVGVTLSGNVTNIAPFNGTILAAGLGTGPTVSFGGSGGTWGATMSIWGSCSDLSGNNSFQIWLAAYGLDTAGHLRPFWDINTSYTGGGNLGPQFFFAPTFASGTNTTRQPNQFMDGLPHLYVATFSVDANAFTMTLYVDGAVVNTISGTASTSLGSATPSGASTIVTVGGETTTIGSSSSLLAANKSTYSYAALWNRALSVAEVTTLWSAGQGYPNENSGTRVARHLALSGWSGNTDIGQGLTTMGVSQLSASTAALSALQSTQDTEFGYLYESQEGFAFRGRQARYLTLTPSYTFGENVAAGEYPYEPGLSYDFDPTYVFNQATITRTGGIVAYAQDATFQSQYRYGPKPFVRTVGGNSDNEAVDAANYVVATYSQTHQRLASLVFDLAGTRGVTASVDGTLWYMGLSLEIGMRVTVKRRPKSANSGAGITMSADYFIEAIDVLGIDWTAGTWSIQLLLSPVPTSAQPWILENATYGVLDSTTVLAF